VRKLINKYTAKSKKWCFKKPNELLQYIGIGVESEVIAYVFDT